MTRTVIIVQARMTSTRLPGKVMMPLAGKPVIRHVLQRCMSVPGSDAVVCAVPDSPESAPIENEARMLGIHIHKGSETDVLGRYHNAAEEVGAECIMRVTSDCPAIDPAICGKVLSLIEREGADYACNNMPRSFPHGLDCEAFSFAALHMAHQNADKPAEREHVTPWIRENPTLKRVNLQSDDARHADDRWTLDRPEDYEFFKALFSQLPDRASDWMAIARTINSNPELARLQRACRLKEVIS